MSTVATRFDPFAIANADRPYASYARFRDAGAVLRAGPGVWAIPRYRDVAALLRDARLGPFRFQETYRRYQSHRAAESEPRAARALLEGVLIAAARADHARIRNVLGRALGSRLTPRLQARIEASVTTLLAEMRERQTVDIVPALAYPLPVKVMCDLFGIPTEDGDAVAQRVLTLSKMFSPVIAPADEAAADDAVRWLRQFIGELIVLRQQTPYEDLMSDMARAVVGGVLTRDEAVDNTIFAMFAGLETSISLIAGGCAALAQVPGQLAKLRRPGCVSTAINEFLRYDAPTQITARVVVEPIEIGGQSLQKGRIVLLLLASANRDEREFIDPDVIDLERSHNPHVSFGGGPHYCVGAGLANMESAIVFRRLAETVSSFALAGDVAWERCATPRIYTSVPVRVS